MSETMKNTNSIFKCLGLCVSFSYGKNPCLHIQNSYLIQTKSLHVRVA